MATMTALEQRYLTRRQAAMYSGVSLSTICRLLRDNKLTRLRVLGRVVIDRREIDKLLQRSA